MAMLLAVMTLACGGDTRSLLDSGLPGDARGASDDGLSPSDRAASLDVGVDAGGVERDGGGDVASGGESDGGGDAPVDGRTSSPDAGDASDDGNVDASVDASRDESGDASADASADAAPSPRALSLWVYNAPWSSTGAIKAMAVDSAGRIFVMNTKGVFVVENKKVSPFLTFEESAMQVPALANGRFQDMALGSDDVPYLLAWGGSTFTPTTTQVLRVRGAHAVEAWLTPTANFAQFVSVVAPGKIAIGDRDGLKVFTASDDGQTILKRPPFIGSSECANQDFVLAPSGVFLSNPGCNQSGLDRGTIDGATYARLVEASWAKRNDQDYPNFACIARDGAHGFYFATSSLTGVATEARLFHLDESATTPAEIAAVPTDPTFAFAAKTQSETFAFVYCNLATGPDGSVYYETASQIWKVAP